jgi:hypothetical protein
MPPLSCASLEEWPLTTPELTAFYGNPVGWDGALLLSGKAEPSPPRALSDFSPEAAATPVKYSSTQKCYDSLAES